MPHGRDIPVIKSGEICSFHCIDQDLLGRVDVQLSERLTLERDLTNMTPVTIGNRMIARGRSQWNRP